MFVFDGASESKASIYQVGPALKQIIEDIATKKEGYFKVLAIDCDTDDSDVLKNFPYCLMYLSLSCLLYFLLSLN